MEKKPTVFTARESCTLEQLLAHNMPGKSRTALKHLVAKGIFKVGDTVLKRLDTMLEPGQRVLMARKEEPHFEMPKEVRIVYEDEHLLVVEKAAGLLTIATEKEKKRTAYQYVSDYLKFMNPEALVFVVHRLDRDTSGLLLFAKSEEVQGLLQKDWNRTVSSRHYVAIVEGEIKPAKTARFATPDRKSEPGQDDSLQSNQWFRIDTWLYEHPKSLKVSVSREGVGVRAITNFRPLATTGRHTLLDLELETGRKNQIRVHMAHIGHPIAGDKKYGATTDPIRRLALHAMQIEFKHPITGETLNFTTGVPPRFAQMIKEDEKTAQRTE